MQSFVTRSQNTNQKQTFDMPLDHVQPLSLTLLSSSANQVFFVSHVPYNDTSAFHTSNKATTLPFSVAT